MSDAIRIDRLLYFLRLVKSRTLAQKIVAEGRIRIDGCPVSRCNAPVHAGQVLTLPIAERVRVIRVKSIPNQRGSAPMAQACYDDLSPDLRQSTD